MQKEYVIQFKKIIYKLFCNLFFCWPVYINIISEQLDEQLALLFLVEQIGQRVP